MPPRTCSIARRSRSAARARALDGVGILLAALLAGWTLLAASGHPDARPGPVVLLLAGGVGLVAVGRRAPGPPELVPGLVAVAVGGSLLLGFPDVLRAGGGPTGYANATADLAALGAISAVAAAVATGSPAARRAWSGLAALLVFALVVLGSVAGLAALGVATVLAGWCRLASSAVPGVVGGGLALLLALGLTAAIAVGGDPLGLATRDELRAGLWAGAVEDLQSEPLWGRGPGAGVRTWPGDDDLRWAHHGFLHQAADAGAIGLGLLLGLVGWGFARLAAVHRQHWARALTGAAALTVVSLHATVDHTLHAAAVPLTLALLIGWATRVGERLPWSRSA